MKRIIDIVVSFICLFLSLPIILFFILAISLFSQGPAIIKLPRAGKNGKIFKMYKLRSMDYCTGNLEVPTKGELIPIIGKILRKSFLDELLQFINIIKGEMALVGPRPEIPSIVEKYNEAQRQRLKVKPGLTGLWQISIVRDIPLNQHLEYDFYYLEKQSLFLDMKILAKTVVFCLKRLSAQK